MIKDIVERFRVRRDQRLAERFDDRDRNGRMHDARGRFAKEGEEWFKFSKHKKRRTDFHKVFEDYRLHKAEVNFISGRIRESYNRYRDKKNKTCVFFFDNWAYLFTNNGYYDTEIQQKVLIFGNESLLDTIEKESRKK